MKKILLTTTAVLLLIAPSAAHAETLQTRIGELSFTQDFANGYPTDETSKKLYEEMDFQRATQAALSEENSF